MLFLNDNRLGPGESFRQMDPFLEPGKLPLVGHSGDADEVGLFDSIARMGQSIGEFAVVGHENQTLARPVEPADGEDPLLGWYQIDDPRAATGIVIGRDDADRLVDGEIKPFGLGKPLTIDADLVPGWIDPRSELHYHLAIDFNPPLADQVFTVAPAAKPGCRQHLLQALADGGLVGLQRLAHWKRLSNTIRIRDFGFWMTNSKSV